MKELNDMGLRQGDAMPSLRPVAGGLNVIHARAASPASAHGRQRRQALIAWVASVALRARGATAQLALAPLAACSNKKAKRVFENLANGTHGVVVGNPSSPKTVYAFFDTECQHCRLLWRAAAPVLNQARWVWVPLDFVNVASRRRGIDCLSSADPQAWLQAHMAGQTPEPGSGNATLREQADGFMAANRRALDTLPERPGGVPFVVGWHDGDLVLLKSGGPLDLRLLGFHA